MKQLLALGFIWVLIIGLTFWQSNHKSDQCESSGGIVITNLVGFYSECYSAE